MDFSLLRAVFRRTLAASSRMSRRPRRARRPRPQSGSAFASLQMQVLEPRLALAADTGSAKPFWGNGHYYAVTQANTDWGIAQRESRSTYLPQLGMTGGLAAITSAEENSFIANYATGRSDSTQPNWGGRGLRWEAFLAGSDTTDMGTWEGRWLWFTADGLPDNNVIFRESGINIGYTAWGSSRQPDNKGNQDFLAMNPGGGWDDADWKYSDYVTEWGRPGVQFHAGFDAPLSSGTRNGTENGQTATMTISFDRHVPWDYVDIRNSTPLIDIPLALGGTAVVGVDYDLSVSGGDSFYRDGRIYVRNTQSVVLTFTPRNNDTWQAPRSITATLGADGSENIYGIRDSSQSIFGGSGNSSSEVWLFDDEPLLSLGQGAYQFVRVPWTGGTLPANNADFNTNADTLIFDTNGIEDTWESFSGQGFGDAFAMRWETYVRIPETGSYRFRSWSDDGSLLTVRRNNGGGEQLATISDWQVGGGRGGITAPISLQKGDVVWLRYDYFEYNGPNYAHLNWDRPDGSGGTITDQPIPGSVMFLSESLARGVNRTESPAQDTSALGFQLFANQPTKGVLRVHLASTSETANSTVNAGLAQRRTNSTRVGDDYAIVSGGSQLTTSQIGVNGVYGTLGWQPNRPAGSLQNVQSFDVQVLTDSYAEAPEEIRLDLVNIFERGVPGYGVSNASQTLTIQDSPFVLSVAAGRNPRETGDGEADLGWFTVSTNGRAAPAGGLRVRYAITGGSATRNADYTAPQATLSTTSFQAEDLVVVPPGATEARIFIAALADAVLDLDETVTLQLIPNVETDDQNFRFQRYAVDPAASQATLTITDSVAYAAAVIATPADRTGLGTVRAQLTGGQQVASFDVHVTSQPRAAVVVSLAATSGSLSNQQLTFTSGNWTQPQRVTLTGLRTDQLTTVSITSASGDPEYAGLGTQQRIVPSNWASELELSLWEGGAMLAAQPTAAVHAGAGVEGLASQFGFSLSLGSPAAGSPVELLYALKARDGFTLEGAGADVRHEPDATYRPLVFSNSAIGSGGPAYADVALGRTVSGGGTLSAQAWVRRDAETVSPGVIEFSAPDGRDRITLGFAGLTGKPRLEIRSASGAVLADLVAVAPLPLGEWNHLAYSIDRDRVASLYVNGERVAQQTLSSEPTPFTERASNTIGRSIVGDGSPGSGALSGAVRSVAVWNESRSQEAIQASMLVEAPQGDGVIISLPLNNSLADTVGKPAAVLRSGSGTTAGFAATPIYARFLPVGSSRVDVPLEVLDDLTAESIESLTVSLVDSGRYSIGGASGTGTAELTDDDTADVEFLTAWSNLDGSSAGWTSTSQFRISEADGAQNTQTRLGIRLTSRPTGEVRLTLRPTTDVRVSLPDGSPGAGIELVFIPATWDQVQELRLQGVDDAVVDGDLERLVSFRVTTSDRTYARLAPTLSVLVLDDDTDTVDDGLAADRPGSAAFATVSAPTRGTIAEDGSESAVFTVTLSAPAAQDTLVFFDLEQSNRQLFASDVFVTPGAGGEALTGVSRFDAVAGGAERVGVDGDGIDETSATFAAGGLSGEFTTTWSGFIAIPETGSYTFSVPVQGGARLSLNGQTVIDRMFDAQAVWSTDPQQLNRGDFVAFTLDYQSFNAPAPAVALWWERPTGNNTDSESDPVPAEALSRVDGFHLLIAKGGSSATVSVRGVDDAVDELDEALAVRLLSGRGVELVASGQTDSADGPDSLDIRLGTTDRETVTLPAGTVLELGPTADANGMAGTTVAAFTLDADASVHRDRTARLSGTLIWVDEAARASLGGSVAGLAAGFANDLYQVPDPAVTLTLAEPLTADPDAGPNRFLASLSLAETNRERVELPAGTRLVYVTAATEETVTLVLVAGLSLDRGLTAAGIPVSTEERSRDLDLTSAASPLVGLGSQVALPDTARLTITDDDTAGLVISLDVYGFLPVGGAPAAVTEGGAGLTRYLTLTSQPNDAVTVYLETADASEARLQVPGRGSEPASARIALTFTPENWNRGQAVTVVPVDDRLDDGDQDVTISARTTSTDPFYAIPAAGSLAVTVRDNDSAGLAVELQQTSISRAGNGFVNLALSAEPTADVVVTLTPSDRQFTINDRAVGRAETITFTPADWSVPQAVNVLAVDDEAVEDLSTSTLAIVTASPDARFHGLAVEPVAIVISDDDLPTATLEFVNDGEEQGRPGRFRIRLSDPTASSAGSSGLVVNYEITTVALDSSLPYGGSVGDRLGRVAQTPTGTSGSVRVAPGESTSDVLVVPIDDFLADRSNKAITVRLTTGAGYAVAGDGGSTAATIEILNDDAAGILVMTSGERILVDERGSAATFQLALLSEPTAGVTVTIGERVAPGTSRQLGTSSAAYATTVTFSRSNWYVPQQISVRSFDDLTIEDGTGSLQGTGIHAAELGYAFTSTDSNYHTAAHTGDASHFTNFVQGVAVLDYELADTTATAMQAALTTLQEGIDSLALPIVGSLDGKTGAGLRKFITNLANSIRVVGTPTPAKLSRLISREIATALGVAEEAVRVEVSMGTAAGGGPAVIVRFGFADDYVVTRVPLAADFGLPGLGFQTEGSFDAAFSYEAGLELVFPRTGEVYLDTGSEQTFVRASFNAGLTEEFRLSGGLGLMQLEARNQPSVNSNVTIAGRPADTELDVGIVLTLGGDAGGDRRLTFTELTSAAVDYEEVFQYGLSGNAAMSLGVTTSVAGIATIPSFAFDLSAMLPLFDYSNQTAAAAPQHATSVYFDNIRLDLGSFITDLVEPIVAGLDTVLMPLYPLVDALYSDTKVFAAIGLGRTFDVDRDGKTSTIDLAQWTADFYSKIDVVRGQKLKEQVDDTVFFLDLLKGVMDLTRELERLDPEEGYYVDFGSYELAAFPAGLQGASPTTVELDEQSTRNLRADTKRQAETGGTNQWNGSSSRIVQTIMSKANEQGFVFPLIEDPANAVKLLLGWDVTLFEWRMPNMGMSSEIDKYFPIYAGIEGVIEGGFEVEAHLGFGFDTYGLSQWRRDGFVADSSWKVFNGFYVADLDENGRDIPEFTMDASMGAGLGYNARVVRADITGGLGAAARMDLLDEGEIAGTSDGKIRGQEIVSRISNPLSLFELSGELTAYLKARVRIGIDVGLFSIWRTVWQKKLAEITVFKFGIGGRYGSGTASNGHLAGATVFFDGNMNGRIDSLEPVTISDAEGRYALDIDLRTFDTNHNGRIDDTEGRLVAFGGVDTTMDQLLAMPFVAPLGSMITPLTTLYYFAEGAGVPAAEVDAFIRTEFDLGDFDYLTEDPLAVLAESASFDEARGRDALSAYLAHIKLHLAWDLVAGGLEQLLPDDVPTDPASKLDLLKGFTSVLLEQPRDLPIEEGFARAVTEAWRRANPDSDPRVADLAARAVDMAAAAAVDVAERLDGVRAEAYRSGASPAVVVEAINGLKRQAFSIYRETLAGISEGLYRITDPEELGRTVTERLEAVQNQFIDGPPADLLADVPADQTHPLLAPVAGDNALVKTGAGTLTVGLANTHAGGTSVTAGTLLVRNPAAFGTGPLVVAAGATVVLDVGTETVRLGSLSLAEGARLDIGAARLEIGSGVGSDGVLRSWLSAGRGDGSWTGGQGIGSTFVAAAPTGMAIGFVVRPDGTATVTATAEGDLDLDSDVDAFDLVQLLSQGRYATGTAADWAAGDVTYDGVVDSFDLVRIRPSGTASAPTPTVAAQVAPPVASLAPLALESPERLRQQAFRSLAAGIAWETLGVDLATGRADDHESANRRHRGKRPLA